MLRFNVANIFLHFLSIRNYLQIKFFYLVILPCWYNDYFLDSLL